MKVSKNFYVGFRQINYDYTLKSSELLNLFVDVAGVQSEGIGDGYTSSYEKWILIGYNVKVFKKPEYATDICLTTWSRNYNQVVASREFEVRDKNGDLCVVALADFVRYDVKEKKLKKITGELMDKYISEPESTNFGGASLKKVVLDDTFDGAIDEFVDWKWLDLNRHMNNSHYVELAERVVEKVFEKSMHEFSFDVLYKKEITENSPIKVYYKKLDENEYKVIIKSADDKTVHAGIRFYK
ncbi:MAG: hypothetical protein IKC83_01620 [Clostridia bacterium]|nr:hypothetical protein [Clostridia bacterium]